MYFFEIVTWNFACYFKDHPKTPFAMVGVVERRLFILITLSASSAVHPRGPVRATPHGSNVTTRGNRSTGNNRSTYFLFVQDTFIMHKYTNLTLSIRVWGGHKNFPGGNASSCLPLTATEDKLIDFVDQRNLNQEILKKKMFINQTH